MCPVCLIPACRGTAMVSKVPALMDVWVDGWVGRWVGGWPVVVCWLVAQRPSNMLVYLRDGSAQTILRAARHTEIETADQTFCLTQSQYTDTGPTTGTTETPACKGTATVSNAHARMGEWVGGWVGGCVAAKLASSQQQQR